MLENSHIKSRRSSLAALCLTAALGFGNQAEAQAPVIDPKIPLPTKIIKGLPDLISPTLNLRLRTELVKELPADEFIKLPGNAELFKVGTRINDKADRAKNPEATLENVVNNKREFEIPVKLKEPEAGRFTWAYQPFSETDKDVGYAVTSLVSPSLVVLSSKSARFGNRVAHGIHPLLIVSSQTEVVNTNDCTAYGVRIHGVKQDRYVGKDNKENTSPGPYTHMIGTTLTIVQRSFSPNSDEGDVCTLTVHKTESKLIGMSHPDKSPKDKGKEVVSITEGVLLTYFISRSDGTVEGFGNWLKAREALPPKFIDFFEGDLNTIVDKGTLDSFFGTSTPPITNFVPANSPDKFTGEPMSPVDPDLVRTEGGAYMITAARYVPAPSLNLRVFSPGFSPSAIRALQKDATNPKKPFVPWFSGTSPESKILQEATIGDLVVQHDTTGGLANRAMICGAKGYVPAFSIGKQGASGILLDAASAAFGQPIINRLDPRFCVIDQLMGVLGTNPNPNRTQAALKIEHVTPSAMKQSSKAGIVNKK